MQTPHSNQNLLFKKNRKLSEASIIHGAKTTSFWKLLFFKTNEAFWMLFTQYLEASAQINAYCYTAVTRCKHGQLVCGLSLTAMGASIMLSFNSTHIWPGLAPFAAFAVPIIPFFNDAQELKDFVIEDIHSPALAIYCGVFVISSFVHVTMCWMGFGNKKSDSQRGLSYLYLLIERMLGKQIKVGMFFIHLLEALVFTALGLYLWIEQVDTYFGSFLTIISINEAYLLLAEKSRQMHIKPLIQA